LATIIDPGLSQNCSQFVSITDIMRVELDIGAKYDETLAMCKNPADLKKLHGFSKEKRCD